MKSYIHLLLVTGLLINSELIAGYLTPEDISKEIDRINYVETAKTGIALGGYVDAGYLYNFSGQGLAGRTGTDGNPNGDFNLNQIKLYLEKPLAEEIDRFQAGFRVDLMYGEDAAAFGQGPASSNALYVQQAYISLGVPVGNGLRVDVGKWAALVGFESENRVENVNITYGYSAAVDPAWHTGIVATYPVTDLVEIGFGVSNGNGIDSSNGVVAGVNDSSDAVGLTGFALLSNEAGNAELQGSFYYAPDGDIGYGTDNEPLLVLNLWGVWVPEISNEKLMLAFNTSFATFNDFGSATINGGPADDSSQFYTVALYAKYYLNDIVSLAGRAEYVHTTDDNILGLGPARSHDLWSWTGTLGFDLTDDLLLRFEYRTDIGSFVMPAGGSQVHTAAMQVVYSF